MKGYHSKSKNPRGGVAKVVIAAAVFLGAVLPAYLDAGAQVRQRRIADQYQITSQISEAMRMLSSDTEKALNILRRVDRQHPGEDRVISKIGFVFQVMGQADSAETYYKRAIALNPKSLEAGKSLGMLYLTSDRQEEAAAVFDRLLGANDHSLVSYKAVGSALRDLGRYDEALRIYEQGRARGNRYSVLTLEIAGLYRANGDYLGALDEYIAYAGDQRSNYGFLRTAILDMIHDAGDQRDRLIEAMESKIPRSQNRYVLYDILSACYLEMGRLESSLDMALRADAERKSDGAILLSLADAILAEADAKPREGKRQYLDLGVRALDAFTRNHARAAGSDRAGYTLARIYVRLGSNDLPGGTPAQKKAMLEKALAGYNEVFKKYPNSEYAEKASLERGDLLLYDLKRPREALTAYKTGAVNSRRYGDVFAARLAQLYLGLGEYDDARHYLDGLLGSRLPELAETGAYFSGLMLALQGNYELARDTLSVLAESDPSSRFANDAIETAWILQEGLQGQSKSLPFFVSAMRAELVGDTASVVSELSKIVDGPVYDTMRPRALYKLGTTLYEAGDYAGAEKQFRRFLDEYPASGLRPDVQRAIAQVYENGYENYPEALREYEVVLMHYPDYAFLDEVRKDIRRLRFIVEGEE